MGRLLAWYILLLGLAISSCQTSGSQKQRKAKLITLNGETMGTTYSVKYLDAQERNFQSSLDSILIAINDEVSTYIPSSTISKFNSGEGSQDISGKIHFIRNYEMSTSISETTEGYFEPTVMPLVNYWGFGYKGKVALDHIDSTRIKEIMTHIGLDLISENKEDHSYVLQKEHPAVELDFSAIAKGYAVDYLGDYLSSRGIENYLVEIGGENRARGVNQNDLSWSIGINTPMDGAALDDMIIAIRLTDKAIATSGDYRQFYEINGKKYSHEIDPRTGYPKTSTLISVSVIADQCAVADAWSTAFIVMGTEKSMELVEKVHEIEACFIVSDEEMGFKKLYSSEFKKFIIE